MNTYTVKEIKRIGGVRFAVVFQGREMFVQKEEEKAEGIAMKMNLIQRRRLLNNVT